MYPPVAGWRLNKSFEIRRRLRLTAIVFSNADPTTRTFATNTRARAREADDGGKTKTADAWPPGRGSTSVATSQARCSAAPRQARNVSTGDRAGRYIQPEPEVQLLIDQLRLTLPPRPPPKIHRPRLWANAPGVVKTFLV